MFVSDNSIASVRNYFNERLDKLYSSSELKLIFNSFLEQRFQLTKTELMLADNLKCSESDLLFFRSCVKRLRENEPFQYVLGSTEFYGLEIKCDSRALIPRPETEELVDWIVKETANKESRILDLCTGSGCIALGVKSSLPKSVVHALDYSEHALALAKENVSTLNLDVHVFSGNVLDANALNEITENYDIFVSNPPYIPVSDKKDMHANVLDYEPEMALFVENNNPFLFYEKIIQLAMKSLNSKGKLYFEIHEKYASDILDLFQKYKFKDIEIRQDMQGKDRMMCATKPVIH